MRHAVSILFVAALCPAIPAPALAAPASPAVSVAERDPVVGWLRRDCAQGLRASDITLLRATPRATEVLMSAVHDGPPDELLRRYEAAFAAAFEERAVVLAEDGARLFSEADAARLQRVDRAAYVGRRLDQARLNYRTNAVLALGIVGGEGVDALLKSIAEDEKSPLREAAITARGYLRGNLPAVLPDK